MTPHDIQPLGAAIAIVFVGTLTAVLWWMLHPPSWVPAAAAKARQSLSSVKRILVPTIGSPYAERGVELACRLGETQRAEVILAYVMEVPRTLPLGVPLPDAEQKAAEALKRAASITVLHEMPTRSIVQRARVAGDEITKIAKSLDVDMIVLGIQGGTDVRSGGLVFGKTSETIMKSSPCEVVISRLPEASV